MQCIAMHAVDDRDEAEKGNPGKSICRNQNKNVGKVLGINFDKFDDDDDGNDDDLGAVNKLIRGRCLTSVTRIDLMKQRS